MKLAMLAMGIPLAILSVLLACLCTLCVCECIQQFQMLY